MRHHLTRRPRPRWHRGLLLIAVAVSLVTLPAAAQADSAFQSVFKAYTQGQGKLSACQFSAAVLKSARGQIPADLGQYAPDFGAALDAALAAHARGACSASGPGGGSSAGGSSAGSGAGPGSAASASGALSAGGPNGHGTPAPPPGPMLHSGADGGLAPVPLRPARVASASGPVILLGVIGLLTAAIALSSLLIGGTGVGTHRLGRLHHVFSEAGLRAGATWSEFGHWLRAGR